MQTSFTTEQLKDPGTAAANQVLRTCVHCGLCTATCPTFVLLGDELDSPRGRIYLIKDMIEAGRPATPDVVRHVDRCLSCLACMTTCPSGVNYMHLVDHARTYIEETYRRPWPERQLRSLLALVLPRPRLMRLALWAAGPFRPLTALLPKQGPFWSRIAAISNLAPTRLPRPSPVEVPATHKAIGQRRGRVALLAGCAQQVLDPEINTATVRLLTRLGIEVVVARGAGCCGALTHHMGKHDAAMASARANIAAWTDLEADGPLDAIIVNTSGCGTTLKDYGFMFRSEPSPWRDKAERVSALAKDISEYLVRIGYVPTQPAPDLTVAYHAACSLQHGQRVTAAPKDLLRAAGFRVVEPAESHLCCGSAGTYNLLQPEIAGRLRARKLDRLAATKPDLIAAGNIGCLTQLANGGLPVVHTVQLLDWMAGGPRPEAIEHSTAKARAPKLLAIAALLLAAATAHAQSPAKPTRQEIDHLLDALAAAPDEATADKLETRIREAWERAGSPAANLLLGKGARDLSNQDPVEAVDDYDSALALEPNLTDAFRQRAAARFAGGDYAGALADLGEALKREPRDFPALETLSRIAEARNDYAGALEAWKKALTIDPKMPGGSDRLETLTKKVEGEQL